jgi:hypothetical protein
LLLICDLVIVTTRIHTHSHSRTPDELYAGICDGLTYKEIEEQYPEEFARRQEDKLTYRYPRGESYMDVTLRLENVVLDIERTREPILIVGECRAVLLPCPDVVLGLQPHVLPVSTRQATRAFTACCTHISWDCPESKPPT